MSAVVRTFLQGGPLMWPLLLCSLVAVTVVVERALFWLGRARARERSSAALSAAVELIREGDRMGASTLLQSAPDPIGPILAAGCGEGGDAAAIERLSAPFLRTCRRGLRALDTVITVAPMLGLLGTVVGVIQAFGFVGSGAGGGQLNMTVVGGGIAEALITTAFGLAVAIVSVVPYNFFASRVEREAEELSSLATEIEEALRHEDTLRA